MLQVYLPLVIRGFHVYCNEYGSHIQEGLKDCGNQEDRFPVAVVIRSVDNNKANVHLPKEFSCLL